MSEKNNDEVHKGQMMGVTPPFYSLKCDGRNGIFLKEASSFVDHLYHAHCLQNIKDKGDLGWCLEALAVNMSIVFSPGR